MVHIIADRQADDKCLSRGGPPIFIYTVRQRWYTERQKATGPSNHKEDRL